MMSETFGPPRWSVASHGSPSKPLDLTLMSKEACWCEKGIGVCVCVCVRVRACVKGLFMQRPRGRDGWKWCVCCCSGGSVMTAGGALAWSPPGGFDPGPQGQCIYSFLCQIIRSLPGVSTLFTILPLSALFKT